MTPRTGTWTRTAAVLAAALGLAASSRAAVIAYDDLEAAAPGSLGGQTSGTGFAGGYVLGSGSPVAIVTNQSLRYDGGDFLVDGGTNCLYITIPNVTAVFTRAIGTQNGDSLYLSFLFRTPTADGGADEDFLSFGFNDKAGETTAGVMHRLNAGNSDHAFGIRYGSSDCKGILGTEPNQTCFLVLRLRKLTPGTANTFNELALFVDPTSVYEPAPTLVVTNSRWAAATHIAARIALAEAGDCYYLDNFCVGTSYDDVLFPAGSPVVATPVVSPPGGMFNGAVEVTLTTATEGASIRYTTDGSAPTSTHGTLYTGAFTLTSSARLRAIAYKDGMFDSLEASANFVVTVHWTGAGADDRWSTAANWDPAISPAGADVVFGTQDRTPSTTVNNVVDESIGVSSISFTNTTKIAAKPSSATWHVTRIDGGTTLTVDGGNKLENAVLVGGVYASGEHGTYVRMTGGGAFAVEAEDGNFLCANTSNDNRGDATLDMAGLSSFTANVNRFWAGRGSRTQGILVLAAAGTGTNSIAATQMAIGDGYGAGEANGTSEVRLGPANVLRTDLLLVGAATPPLRNVQRGRLGFQSGLSGGAVVIRGLNGDAVSSVVVGSHGGASSADRTIRNVSGTMDFTGGTVDAKFGALTVGEGRGFWASSGGIGTVDGGLSMMAGRIDAETVVLGRSTSNNSTDRRNGLVTGKIDIGGGRFNAGSISLANNMAGANQIAIGILTVRGSGQTAVASDVCMGVRAGTAPVVTARVDVAGGVLRVGGDMAPGNDSTNVVAEVLLNGGTLSVTNAAGDATLRIENGTFVIAAGTAVLDRLVMTNDLAVTKVVISGAGRGGCGQVTVNNDVLLGGGLEVALDNYAPPDGEMRTIVAGRGSRVGVFQPERLRLPEGMRVVYTANGFALAKPARGTLIILR
jgi:hypothetical protein